MSAANTLRQAIEALHGYERSQPWRHEVERDDTHVVKVGSMWVLSAGNAASGAGAAEFAALMDPTVGAALADLLDAIRGDKIDWRALHGDAASAAWKRHVFDARDFLEQAITREAS